MSHLYSAAVSVKTTPDAITRHIKPQHRFGQSVCVSSKFFRACLLSQPFPDIRYCSHHPHVSGIERGHTVNVSRNALQEVNCLTVIGQYISVETKS